MTEPTTTEDKVPSESQPKTRGLVSTMFKNAAAEIKLHQGPYTRLFIYLAIAFLVTVQTDMAGLTPERVASMHWWHWVILVLNPWVQLLIVWRTFIDSSLQDSKDAGPSNQQIISSTTLSEKVTVALEDKSAKKKDGE